MDRAIELSRSGMLAGEGGPFGAVIVRDGQIIAEGNNRVVLTNDPTDHAEIVAIRAASQFLGTFLLSGCELYASAEPCPMCLGAIYWARLDRVYYANTRQDSARIGFDDSVFYGELSKPKSQRDIPAVHLPDPRALAVFDEWFLKVDKVRY